MFLLFHILIAITIAESISKSLEIHYNRYFLIIGALIPDFDKILSILHISSGRGYCHTILFSIVCILCIFFISKPKSFSFALGIISHLILDYINLIFMNNIIHRIFTTPLLFPFSNCDFSPTQLNPIKYFYFFLTKFLENQLIFFTEIISSFILVGYLIFLFMEVRKKEIIIVPLQSDN